MPVGDQLWSALFKTPAISVLVSCAVIEPSTAESVEDSINDADEEFIIDQITDWEISSAEGDEETSLHETPEGKLRRHCITTLRGLMANRYPS